MQHSKRRICDKMEIYYERRYWMPDVYECVAFVDTPKPIISSVYDRDVEIMCATDANHFTFGTIQESLSTKDMR